VNTTGGGGTTSKGGRKGGRRFAIMQLQDEPGESIWMAWGSTLRMANGGKGKIRTDQGGKWDMKVRRRVKEGGKGAGAA